MYVFSVEIFLDIRAAARYLQGVRLKAIYARLCTLGAARLTIEKITESYLELLFYFQGMQIFSGIIVLR